MTSKPVKKAKQELRSYQAFRNRDGLAAYAEEPATFGPERIVYHNDKFVCINDLYPKATVHLLIIPRDKARQEQHPFDALGDPDFLAEVGKEVEKAKEIASSELKRQFGSMSKSSEAYNKGMEDAMEADDLPDTLPEPRDWAKEIRSGIHAHPSMNHLHIHVLSRDMHSERMRHRKHYNSFNTGFFVPLDDFPLDEHDARLHPGKEGYLKEDFVCWRCSENFGNKFAKLKAHLEEEWDAWRRE
jgi:aprataxin